MENKRNKFVTAIDGAMQSLSRALPYAEPKEKKEIAMLMVKVSQYF